MRAVNHRPPSGQATHRGDRKRGWSKRKGAVVVFSAFLMIMLMAMLAFSVDLGYVYTMKAQLQRSVDAAALAGAGALIDGDEMASDRVVEYLVRNPVGNGAPLSGNNEEELAQQVSQFLQEHSDDLEVELGHWDPDTRSIDVSDELPSTVSVSMTYPNNPLFFSRFLGHEDFTITAKSIAMYQPRDIVLVLDFSASMNDDSEFKSFDKLSREAVEANLLECYNDLGQPTYGDLGFEPKYAVVHGVAQNDAEEIPHISVEYRRESVYVTSTHEVERVTLEFHDGTYWSSGWLGGQGITEGEVNGGNTSKRIVNVWVRSWNNEDSFGEYGEKFDFESDLVGTLKEALGLDGVAYPYNSGSWNDYIEYCIYSDTQNYDAGYRYQFGYMNLLNYWFDEKPMHGETADLWKVSAQPVTAVKDAVDVFMDYIQEVDTNDRVGLAAYNYSDGDGVVEKELTSDFDALVEVARQRQAGHYHHYTNIGAGLEEARVHLDQYGRAGAFKMIVLMTDGKANWVDGGYDTSGAEQYVLGEADACGESHYPIVTISLGAGADTDLMAEVAERSHEGEHFNVPGNQSVAEYSAELLEVFREIADARPLKLVQ